MAGARFRARPGARSRETRDGGQIPERARVRRRPAACGRRRDPHAAARGEAHHRQHPLRQIQLETMTKRLLCRAVEVPENGLKECEADGGLKVVVAKAGGEFFGFQAICPHQEVPLCEGLFDGSVLTCHMHLWQWDVRTGAPLGIAEAPLQRYRVAVEGDSLSRGGIYRHAPARRPDRALPSIIGSKIMKLKAGLVLLAALAAGTAAAAEPVKLVVGYQPYDTISYSAVVIRALELWKKHLPPGSEVEFQNALQGSIIVNQMLANKQQIGYLGDMPAVVATTKRRVAPSDLVANTGLSPGQRCNVIMVRADAPKFSSPQEAVRWLDGKTLATPQGSCAHRFLGLVIETTKIKPAAILNQSIEVIATNLRAGKIDAAVLWEPSVSRIGDIVGECFARIVATGHTFGISDAGAVAMREDFIKARPDIVEAWLRTELEAQQYVLDPKNWTKVAEFVKSQTAGITVPMAWFSIYGAIPAAAGGSPIRDEKPFVFDQRVRKLLAETYLYLHQAKVIDVDKPAPGALDDSFARKVAQAAGVTLPLGIIKAQDLSKLPK